MRKAANGQNVLVIIHACAQTQGAYTRWPAM